MAELAKKWVVFRALQNPLYRSGYALIANTVGTTGIGIIYWAVATHLYSRQTVGQSSALIAALALVSSFAQLNLGNTLPRFIPHAGRTTGQLIAYSYGASALAALVGGLAFVIVLPQLSSQWHFLSNSLPLSVAFVTASVIWGVFALQDFVLLSLRRSVIVPAENFVYGICKLFLLAGIVWLLPKTGIFFSWIIPLGLTVPAVNWLIFRRYLKNQDIITTPSTLSVREVVRFASVDYLGTVLSQAYGSLLPLLVLSTLGPAANGIFYIAWTIASGLGLLATNFGASLLVEGAAAPHRLAELTRGVLIRCIGVTGLGAAIFILAAHPILHIYGSGYAAHASSLLALLALGSIPSGIVILILSLDRVTRRVGRASCTRLVLTVLVLGGSWVLVRRIGLDGVAFAWGGANLLVALVRSSTIVRAIRKPSQAPSHLTRVRSAALLQPEAPVRGRHRRPSQRPGGRHSLSKADAILPPRYEIAHESPMMLTNKDTNPRAPIRVIV